MTNPDIPQLSAVQTAILCQAFAQAADDTAGRIISSMASASYMAAETDQQMVQRMSEAWEQVIGLGLMLPDPQNPGQVNFEPEAYDVLRENLKRHGFTLGGGDQ